MGYVCVCVWGEGGVAPSRPPLSLPVPTPPIIEKQALINSLNLKNELNLQMFEKSSLLKVNIILEHNLLASTCKC